MLKLLYINIALVILFVTSYSCQSPVDVEANRQKKILKLFPDSTDPGINADFNELDYGIIFKNSKEQLKQIKIMNVTDKKLFISGCSVTNFTAFNVDTSIFPLTLEPKGLPGSDFILKISFNPNNTGQYLDTLRFKNIPNVFIKLKATVPTIFVKDLEFSETEVGDTTVSSILIYNFGNHWVEIKNNVNIADKDNIFKFIDVLPRTINPQSFLNLKVEFTPKEAKEYISQIVFDFETENKGPIINYGILKGNGKRK